MSIRDNLLTAIENDPYDQSARLLLADWLTGMEITSEERRPGDEELAAYQMRWTPEVQRAEEWLHNFASRIRSDYDEDEEDYFGGASDVTYEELMNGAHAHLGGGNISRQSAICLGFYTPDFIWKERERFWECFELVTGCTVEDKDDMFFRCAC